MQLAAVAGMARARKRGLGGRHAWLIAAAVLTGCPAVDPSDGLSTSPVAQAFDYNGFVCDALPVLVRRCAHLGCHGDARRAFRVYSPGKLRAGDVTSRADRDAPMTADELALDYASATGVLVAALPAGGGPIDATRALLLQKPLAARFGGGEHEGIGVFPVAPKQALDDDQEWLALSAWVTGTRQPSPPTAACQALFAALGATPR